MLPVMHLFIFSSENSQSDPVSCGKEMPIRLQLLKGPLAEPLAAGSSTRGLLKVRIDQLNSCMELPCLLRMLDLIEDEKMGPTILMDAQIKNSFITLTVRPSICLYTVHCVRQRKKWYHHFKIKLFQSHNTFQNPHIL